jgi:hypothetical protein
MWYIALLYEMICLSQLITIKSIFQIKSPDLKAQGAIKTL